MNKVKRDGWLLADNDDFAIGYYVQADLPFLGQAAPEWTTCSRYFSAIMASTHRTGCQHAGVTDRLDNSVELSNLPTIWDRLADAGRTRALYYASDASFLLLWGAK